MDDLEKKIRTSNHVLKTLIEQHNQRLKLLENHIKSINDQLNNLWAMVLKKKG